MWREKISSFEELKIGLNFWINIFLDGREPRLFCIKMLKIWHDKNSPYILTSRTLPKIIYPVFLQRAQSFDQVDSGQLIIHKKFTPSFPLRMHRTHTTCMDTTFHHTKLFRKCFFLFFLSFFLIYFLNTYCHNESTEGQNNSLKNI